MNSIKSFIFFKNSLLLNLFKTNYTIKLYIRTKKFPKTLDEEKKLFSLPVESPKASKFNKVAILGAPNSGKSTLVNSIVGYPFSSVSSKVHTTRKNIIGLITIEDTQIEFIDTPGAVTPYHVLRHNLEHEFLKNPVISSNYANILAIVVDVSIKSKLKIQNVILKLLFKHREKKSILILNKIDKIKNNKVIIDKIALLTSKNEKNNILKFNYKLTKENEKIFIENLIKKTQSELDFQNIIYKKDDILPITDDQTYWPHFSEVFTVSALNGDGIENLKNYFVKTALERPWSYNENIITTKSIEHIVIDVTRSKLLDNCSAETPYVVKIKCKNWTVDDTGKIFINLSILVSHERYKGIIIGAKGIQLRKISFQIIEELTKLFKCEVDVLIEIVDDR